VTVTTAVPVHAAAASSANPSGKTRSLDHLPRVFIDAVDACMPGIVVRFEQPEKRKTGKDL
jgi:hypothetical protein